MPQERERAIDGGRGEPAFGRGVTGPDLPDRGQALGSVLADPSRGDLSYA